MSALLRQFLRFGVVGLGGLVIDVAVFNILRTTVLSPENVAAGPIIAKVISTSLAIVANWIGNRYWTFRTSRGQRVIREGFAFAIVSIGGMLIAVLCLWVSHYVLGFTSVIADNIASNVVGLGLGCGLWACGAVQQGQQVVAAMVLGGQGQGVEHLAFGVVPARAGAGVEQHTDHRQVEVHTRALGAVTALQQRVEFSPAFDATGIELAPAAVQRNVQVGIAAQ